MHLTNPNETAVQVKLALLKASGVIRESELNIAPQTSWRKTLRINGRPLTLLTASSEAANVKLTIRPGSRMRKGGKSCAAASKVLTLQPAKSLSMTASGTADEEIHLYLEDENISTPFDLRLDFFQKKGSQTRSSLITLEPRRLKRAAMGAKDTSKILISTLQGEAVSMAALKVIKPTTKPRSCMRGIWFIPAD